MNSNAEAGSHASVKLSRVFNTSVQHLFECFTQPELIARWWGPEGTSCPSAQAQLEVGGKYRFVMQGAAGEEPNVVHGEYLVVEPPERLVFTWAWEDPAMEAAEAAEVTQVTLLFRPVGEKQAEVALTHELFLTAERASAHRDGWGSSLECLACVLEPASRGDN
jgi:uncharacterized protein YndB with AHSA1/START domain